jgi:MSHA biogenesis protein MshO
MTRPLRSSAGFTLVEAIVAIVITGILSAIVATFIARPVEGYVASVRRAELTDAADVALRRMTRDVRLALPNSLRVTSAGGVNYIEFIMTSAGGRYRSTGDGSTAGNFLSFTSATASFDVLGAPPANLSIAPGDYIVVYNLGDEYAPANAYDCGAAPALCTGATAHCNRAQVDPAWGGANPVALTAATQTVFCSQSPPIPSPDSRFQVVPGAVRAVTYACPTAAGNLTMQWNYGFNPAQVAPPVGGTTATLAANASCTVTYTPAAATGRNGVLFVQLTLTSGDESVTLFQQIHVDNAP